MTNNQSVKIQEQFSLDAVNFFDTKRYKDLSLSLVKKTYEIDVLTLVEKAKFNILNNKTVNLQVFADFIENYGNYYLHNFILNPTTWERDYRMYDEIMALHLLDKDFDFIDLFEYADQAHDLIFKELVKILSNDESLKITNLTNDEKLEFVQCFENIWQVNLLEYNYPAVYNEIVSLFSCNLQGNHIDLDDLCDDFDQGYVNESIDDDFLKVVRAFCKCYKLMLLENISKRQYDTHNFMLYLYQEDIKKLTVEQKEAYQKYVEALDDIKEWFLINGNSELNILKEYYENIKRFEFLLKKAVE